MDDPGADKRRKRRSLLDSSKPTAPRATPAPSMPPVAAPPTPPAAPVGTSSTPALPPMEISGPAVLRPGGGRGHVVVLCTADPLKAGLAARAADGLLPEVPRLIWVGNLADLPATLSTETPDVALIDATFPTAMEALEVLSRHQPVIGTLWMSADLAMPPTASARVGADAPASEVGWALRLGGEYSKRKRAETLLHSRERTLLAGQLAASVAHDINSPLTVALTNLDLVWEHVEANTISGRGPLPGTLRESLKDAGTGVRMAQRIARDLGLFSRAPENRLRAVDVCEAVEASATLASAQVRQVARFERQYDSVPPVRGDAGRLCQVFTNLLVNAAHAIVPGDLDHNEVRITVRRVRDKVWVEIRDTGEGMTAEVRSRLFTPYFTTKSPGLGTGLGLALAKQYMDLVGGQILVETEPGKGSIFRVILPLADRTESTATLVPPFTVDARSRSRVLVVDDEELVGRAFERALGKSHDVEVVFTGSAAIEKISAGARFDLIFSDMMMPRMSGMELYEVLRRRWPDQAVRMVFITGGTFTPEAARFFETVKNPRVSKPVTADQLRSLVATLARPV